MVLALLKHIFLREIAVHEADEIWFLQHILKNPQGLSIDFSSFSNWWFQPV